LCEFTDVYVIAGTVYIAFYSADTDDQGCYVKNLYITPKGDVKSNATVTCEKDAYDVLNTVATNIYMNNGKLLTDSMVGTFVVRDGTVYYGSEPSTGTAVTEADMDIATLRQHGGTFYWEPDDSGNPTITTAHIFGGMFDASGVTSGDRAKTITTINSFSGATVDLSNDRGNITVTNWYNHGATIKVDDAAKVAISYDQP